MNPISILLIEDNPADADLIQELLLELWDSLSLVHVTTMSGARCHFSTELPNLVLLDLGLPDAAGLESLTELQDLVPRLPVIVLTGLADDSMVRQALEKGAQDFLVKGSFDAELLGRTIRYAIDRSRFVEHIDSMSKELQKTQQQLHKAHQELMAVADERARRIYELAILNLVSQAVTSTLQLDQLLEQLVRHVQDVLCAPACNILLVQRNTLLCMAGSDVDSTEDAVLISLKCMPSLVDALASSTPIVTSVQSGKLHLLPGAAGSSHVMLIPVRTRSHSVALMTAWFQHEPRLDQADTDLVSNIASQAGVAIENAKLYGETELGTRLLRQALIPQTEFHHPGLQAGSRYVPSSLLSGDYFDVLPAPHQRVCLVMADVMGKGTEAAIDAVRAKTIIQSQTRAGHQPREVLEALNGSFYEEDSRLLSMVYISIDLATHTLTFISAGHEPALLLPPCGAPLVGLSDKNLLIGVDREAHFNEVKLCILPGTTLLLYTDGVTEARSPEGEFFARERVEQVSTAHRHASPQQLVDAIYDAVKQFSHGQLSDDLSLLAVRID